MYLKVKVTPGAKRQEITKKEKYWEISVKEEARKNQANKKVIEIVASEFNIPPSVVRIVSGHRHPSKILSIPD